MSTLIRLLDAHSLVAPLDDTEAEMVARELTSVSGLAVYPRSIAAKDRNVLFLGRRNRNKLLCMLAHEDPQRVEGESRTSEHGILKLCPMHHANARALREILPFTASQCTGDKRSFGTGDRLGLATPGHIRAVRGTGVTPILAQQSIREMTRTHRTPEQVMDSATWGVFEEGFREGFGSDADHLKTAEDIDLTLAAGFQFFTVDPGDYVDNAAGRDNADALRRKLSELPWDVLETTENDYLKMLAGKPFSIGLDMEIQLSEEEALRAAVKYGRAVVHTVNLYRHLASASADRPFELEMSVDETDSPTTVPEHFYVAHELSRLGVKVASLAPRFVGDFEKGIDYKGDLKAFEEAFVQHLKIARHFGPYKISVHSGSDKFSIYPIAAKHGGDLVHVKTAGTSYLEALRTLGRVTPELFREILAFAFERYDEDKASYHVSAQPERVPTPDKLKDDQLAGVLEINDGRQLLHVTYGSVLTVKNADGSYRFRDRMLDALRDNENIHYEIVASHIRRHVTPFAVK